MKAHPAHGIALPLAHDQLAVLQAVAEPNRARIVALLAHGEHCVCDVGDALGMSTALVSHHLRTLRGVGLLRERRSGRWVFYSLDVERVEALRAAVVDLLTPTTDAATACLCTDCGSRSTTGLEPSPLSRLPLAAEVSR